MQILQSEINNIEITNPTTGDVSKNLSYHTSHTGFMYQRNLLTTTTEGNLLYKTINLHIKERVIMSYISKH